MMEKKPLRIRPSVLSDCRAIGSAMREADRREIAAIGHTDPVRCLEQALALGGECLTGCGGQVPMAMFGTVAEAAMSDRAVIWMLGTPLLRCYARELLTVSRAYLEGQPYECLYNRVDSRYEESIRWLKRCGFCFFPERDCWFSGVRFLYFERRRKACVNRSV